jgi:hypothetical protein
MAPATEQLKTIKEWRKSFSYIYFFKVHLSFIICFVVNSERQSMKLMHIYFLGALLAAAHLQSQQVHNMPGMNGFLASHIADTENDVHLLFAQTTAHYIRGGKILVCSTSAFIFKVSLEMVGVNEQIYPSIMEYVAIGGFTCYGLYKFLKGFSNLKKAKLIANRGDISV